MLIEQAVKYYSIKWIMDNFREDNSREESGDINFLDLGVSCSWYNLLN